MMIVCVVDVGIRDAQWVQRRAAKKVLLAKRLRSIIGNVEGEGG